MLSTLGLTAHNLGYSFQLMKTETYTHAFLALSGPGIPPFSFSIGSILGFQPSENGMTLESTGEGTALENGVLVAQAPGQIILVATWAMGTRLPPLWGRPGSSQRQAQHASWQLPLRTRWEVLEMQS